MLEQFKQGGSGIRKQGMASESSPDAAGVQFSEEKGGKHIAPLSIGEGILG